MSVAYLIEFKVREGRRTWFLELLSDVLATMAHEATYVAAMLHEDPADPRRFLLHEVWTDHDDVVNIQIRRQYRDAWHAALPELLDGERRIEVWRPVASPPSGPQSSEAAVEVGDGSTVGTGYAVLEPRR